jgi:hypothetical protein
MSVEFDIIYEKLIEIGNELKIIDINRAFFNKANIYQNFFNQLMQILEQPDIELQSYQEKLKIIEQNNIEIELRLRQEKDKIKDTIIKKNLKEKVINKYN